MNYVNAGARLDRLPMTKWHYKLIALIASGMFFDNIDLFVLGSIMAQFLKTGWSTMQMNASLASINFMGLLVGCLLCGVLADHSGRRTMYIYNLLLYSVGTVLCGLSQTFEQLMFFRFCTAIGLGGEIAVGFSTLTEFLPAAVRGKYGAILFLISNVTLPIAFGLGMLVLPLDPEAWRWIFFGCGIPALFVWYIRRSMPESPRWYETVGRYEEAEKVVSEIESYVEKITGQKLPPISADVQPLKLGERHSYLELFSKNMIVRTMWVSVFIMIQLAINFSIVTWLPTAFVQKGIDIQSSLMFSTIIMLGYPIGSYIGALLADRFSRRNVVIVVCTVGAICSYLYGISSSMTLLTILGFLVMTVLSAMFATTWASFIPEQFPTALRVRGFTFGLACGRLSSAISPFWVVFLMDRGGFSSVLLTNSVLFMLLIIIVIFFGVESRGRSLEEVNEIQLYH